ncbi:polyketide synthase dehydratase domain-containing protein, partial [Nonomuraea sp. NPDC001699]
GERDAVVVQVWVAAPDEVGRRDLGVYARPAEAGEEVPWVRHATGVLAVAGEVGERLDAAAWPPPGASMIDVARIHERLAEDGFRYGPVFQGLRAAWRGADGDVFAEVALPEQVADAGLFGVHPALLDSVLHVLPFAGLGGWSLDGAGGLRLPFSWSDVCLHAGGASFLRVRLARTGDESVSLAAVDAAGEPVLSVGSLVLRPFSADQATVAGRGAERDGLFHLDWTPVQTEDAGSVSVAVIGCEGMELCAPMRGPVDVHRDLPSLISAGPVPGAVLVGVIADPAESAAAVAHEVTASVLVLLQEWLADERLEGSRLVFVTRGAVAVGEGEFVADLAAAAVWGLVRSAQSENPGRFVLLDVDAELGGGLLGGVLASGEPQVAVRNGQVWVLRLVSGAGLLPPSGVPWRLGSRAKGSLDALELVEFPQAAAPLAVGQVRVEVHAAGLNFRDLLDGLNALGWFQDKVGLMGGEVAGVVLEVGPEVVDL